MSDLLSFLGAVASHWIALMSGIVSLLITLVLRIKKVEPRDKIFWSIAALCFFIAFFLAWRDEHISVKNIKQELSREKDANAPKLGSHIERVIISESTDGNGSQVFILLSIGNTGGTSIVEDFFLNVRLTDFDHNVRAKDFPGETISLLDEKKSKVTIQPQDTMKIKEGKPIERGYKVRGWLMFLVEGVKPELIRRSKTQFTISFKDVWGQTHSAAYEMPQHSANP